MTPLEREDMNRELKKYRQHDWMPEAWAIAFSFVVCLAMLCIIGEFFKWLAK